MTARRNPEERSAASERRPGQAAAQPTGNEVFTGSAEEGQAHPDMTPEELAELDELERAASEAYEQLGRAAERLSDRAADAYQSGRTFVQDNPGGTLLSSFILGVVLGALLSRD